jgi:hypothetical protein
MTMSFEFRTSDFDWLIIRASSITDAIRQCEDIAETCERVELRTLEYDDETGFWREVERRSIKARQIAVADLAFTGAILALAFIG